MKLYTEEQMKRAIRFGFETSSLLDEGMRFIECEDAKVFTFVSTRYDHRNKKDVTVWEERS